MAPDDDRVANITELEAANVIVALHTFITTDDAGSHILVQCDNLPAVQALTSGRAQNPILAECAQATWMVQAKYAVKLSFSHIAGAHNQVADALSRTHTSQAYNNLGCSFIEELRLMVVFPSTYILTFTLQSCLDPEWNWLAAPSGGEAGTGQSTWDNRSTQDNHEGAGCVLPPFRWHGDRWRASTI